MMTSATLRESRSVSVWGLFAMLLGFFLCLAPAAAQAQTADVSVMMIAASTVQPGGAIMYNATVSNPGPDAATGLTLTLPLPGDATFTSGRCNLHA